MFHTDLIAMHIANVFDLRSKRNVFVGRFSNRHYPEVTTWKCRLNCEQCLLRYTAFFYKLLKWRNKCYYRYLFIKQNTNHHYSKGKGKFTYRAVFNPQDCSKCFTLYSLADLVTQQTPPQLLWEAFSHVTINSQKLLIKHIYSCEGM